MRRVLNYWTTGEVPLGVFKGRTLALEMLVLVTNGTHRELRGLVLEGMGMGFYPHFGQLGPDPHRALPSPPGSVEPVLGQVIFCSPSFQIFQ